MSIFRSYLKLNEEMSISNNVVDVTDMIMKSCLDNLEKLPLKSSNDFNRYFKEGEFDVNVNGIIPNMSIIHIKLFCYIFRNNEEYISHNKTINTNCLADYDTQTIELRLVLINGKQNNEFQSSIQHEVNHIFQYANGASKNETLYDKIVKVSSNPKANYKEKMLAYILYLTFKTEQDSFANQYYAYLKQNNVQWDGVYDYFPDDDGNPYSNFLDAYDVISKMNINDEEISNLFGISKKQFLLLISKADKRMRNKMMKAAAKYRKDITNEMYNLKDTKRISFIVESMSKGIYVGSNEF